MAIMQLKCLCPTVHVRTIINLSSWINDISSRKLPGEMCLVVFHGESRNKIQNRNFASFKKIRTKNLGVDNFELYQSAKSQIKICCILAYTKSQIRQN
jgi:hypothetical protein